MESLDFCDPNSNPGQGTGPLFLLFPSLVPGIQEVLNKRLLKESFSGLHISEKPNGVTKRDMEITGRGSFHFV